MPTVLLVEVVYKLASANGKLRLPDQERADRILPQDRVEEAADLLLRPHERPLNVGQPEAPILLDVVEVRHDLAERCSLEFHFTPPRRISMSLMSRPSQDAALPRP